MLISLSVQDFAIIDNILLDFHDGMNVITGETGAGKSLIIDAIGLLFGKRADNEMIRYGKNKAVIEGVFTKFNDEIINILNNLGITCDIDDNLSIKRELYNSGKSICRINNNVVTLAQLQELAQLIGDIHSQNDTQGLVNPKNYLKFLNDDSISIYLNDYSKALKEYKNDLKEYRDLETKVLNTKEKEEFLKYQYNEFKTANLNILEENTLKEELKFLDNYENIISNLKTFNDIYNSDVLEKIYESISIINKLSNYDNKYISIKNDLENIYYSLDEIVNRNEFKLSKYEFDENRLNDINERLSIYSEFKRKYRKNTEELIEYSKSIENELDMIENFDFYLEESKKKYTKSFEKLLNISKIISDRRKKNAKVLEEGIKQHLFDLQLKNVIFEISFNEFNIENVSFKNDGIDEIDFLVSFNKGEPVKPLSKIASGGEMSRFMLTLKTVLGDKLPLQTKIFDEIDNGVNGVVAYSIAQKIKLISKTSQVLCITHLPQVASICDHHIKITKQIVDERTKTFALELDYENRVKAIAEMISKGVATKASCELAKELLDTMKN